MSSKSASIWSASSIRPCAISHLIFDQSHMYEIVLECEIYLGLSGSHGVVPHKIKMKMNWKATGKRQDTEPPTNENPYVTQLDREKPAMLRIISMTMSLPRQLALDVSPCQIGAVAVLIPLPMPPIILRNWLGGS